MSTNMIIMTQIDKGELIQAVNEICKAARDYRKYRPPRGTNYYDKMLHDRLERAEKKLGGVVKINSKPLISKKEYHEDNS